MFWGLIMEPHRRYTQKVKKAFHISMAALDLSTSSDEPAQVMCGFEGRNYLLCTLKRPDVLQCPLNLNFEVGSEVSFAANGRCHIHLTGYLNEDFTDLEEEEEEEQEEAEEKAEEAAPKTSKRAAKKSVGAEPPTKKSKNGVVTSSQNQEEEEEDSDDSDYLKSLLGKSLDEDDEDDSDVVSLEDEEEEGEGEEDAEEEEEEEELAEEEEESSLSEAEEEVVPKLNGLSPAKPESQKKKKRDKKSKQEEAKKTPNKENQTPKKRTLQGGVIVEELREGQGAPAKPGRFVNVYYEGRLKQNNKMFDSATKGSGFSFRLGNSKVIKGWDVGVAGMKIGGKRRITCPPSMAYGQKGSPPAIPPNSTLVFDVELRKVN